MTRGGVNFCECGVKVARSALRVFIGERSYYFCAKCVEKIKQALEVK